ERATGLGAGEEARRRLARVARHPRLGSRTRQAATRGALARASARDSARARTPRALAVGRDVLVRRADCTRRWPRVGVASRRLAPGNAALAPALLAVHQL